MAPPNEPRNRACFRFYAELNDFLPSRRRHRDILRSFTGRPSVKDCIEALNVPHTEVDLILVNGESVDFSHPVRPGDRISVYPVFEALDISPVVRVRSRPLRITRFVLDAHLGRLAAFLRLAGFDTLYRNDYRDEQLAAISGRQGRILLTRDQGLLKRNSVTHGYWVRATQPRRQLAEILRRFELCGQVRPFERCLPCNGRLARVAKEEVLERLPPRTRLHYDEFYSCRDCGRVYWPGSHHRKLRLLLEESLLQARRPVANHG